LGFLAESKKKKKGDKTRSFFKSSLSSGGKSEYGRQPVCTLTLKTY
jgi:hypothetical protein